LYPRGGTLSRPVLRLVPKADDAGDACSQPATITGRFKLRAAPKTYGFGDMQYGPGGVMNFKIRKAT
jgi:hypothetical protein